jgi:hypothetical protein
MSTVKYVIEQLKQLDKNEEIVIAYWTKEWFTDMLAKDITDDQWCDIVGACDDVIENMPIGDYMTGAAAEVLGGDQ